MKSRHRPPLNLTDAEPGSPDETGDTDGPTAAPVADAAPESTPAEPTDRSALSFSSIDAAIPERPMSERRRRRLLEEQRQAEARAAAEAERARPTVSTFAESVDQPPVAYDPPPAPAPVRPAPAATAGSAKAAYPLAGVASVLWIAGVAAWVAYEAGAGGAALEPLRIAIYALIALAPAGLFFLLAHALRQGAGLAAETRHARDLAEALVAPTALAAQQTGQVLSSLRNDIDQATLATERARNDMALLREALAEETTRLNEAAENAGRTARRLSEQLGREREGMAALGGQLDKQATGVMDAVERQSRMVVDASDLAQTQLREAEAALAARAADMAAAAGEAQDAARLAADDLARQTLRLENTGAGVAEQIHSVEEGLGQQRAALVTAAYALRTDQEDFSAQVESQRAQLTEQLSAARAAAGDLGETSTRTADSMRDLVEAASDQFRALVDMSQREADGFDNATKIALDRFEALAAEARDTLMEETRRTLAALQATADQSRAAAGEAATQAQIRADRLGEALFDAAQKADQAADARIEGARKIVGETAGLVDEAGERSLERLEATLARMTEALAQVDTAIGEVDDRVARLPDEARARADAVRQAVEEGLTALTAASKKAAEDTEALDSGFQDRVRRNYEMLNETARMMGVVSGDAAIRRREPAPAPLAEPEPEPEPAKPARPERERGFGLRGRLRLGPTEAAPAPAANEERPSWTDLIEARDEEPLDLDTPVTADDAEVLAERITAAIRRMGVDPNALLPRARVEEAAEAFAERDPDRARQIVRRVAPAAVRSVSRRVISDGELRTDAERYVRAFGQRLAEDGRGGDAQSVLARLATDAGRAFMLLDAAVGDLA